LSFKGLFAAFRISLMHISLMIIIFSSNESMRSSAFCLQSCYVAHAWSQNYKNIIVSWTNAMMANSSWIQSSIQMIGLVEQKNYFQKNLLDDWRYLARTQTGCLGRDTIPSKILRSSFFRVFRSGKFKRPQVASGLQEKFFSSKLISSALLYDPLQK
jgi:hypothetical protein